MAQPLEDIQDAILDRIHAGETIDRDEILAAHPDHAGSLGGFLDLLAVIEGESRAGGPDATRLGEFRIIREIGRGGMGIVYEAEQPSLKRRVALKVLPPTLRADPRLVTRFQREAEAAGRLRHSGIVPVFSVGEAAGAPFFAMELVEGESLQDHIARLVDGEDRSDRREWAVAIATKVADALSYAHGQGILHRDVKPGNIMVDSHGEPRLTDFGLALDMRAPGLTVPGEVFGSPQYMSPEQSVRQEAPVDERTDVYSLAVTLYELLTLRLPYDATTGAELLTALATGNLVPPRRVDPTIPEALEAVLLRALRNDPRERYESAAAFAADLRACAEERAPVGVVSMAPTPRRVRSRPRWLVPVVAASVVVLVAPIVLFLGLLLSGGREAPRRDPPMPSLFPPAEPSHPEGPGVPETGGGRPELGPILQLAAGLKTKDVSFWLLLDDVLARPDHAAVLDVVFEDRRDRVVVLGDRLRARAAAEAFCLEWNEMYRVGDTETINRYAELEKNLREAGRAAAPYLMSVLGRHHLRTFANTDPSHGPTARMQVRALHAVGMLELVEAIPHVVLHCRGPSQTQVSTASIVLQKLTGEDFDAQWMKTPALAKIDWWSKSAPKDRVGLDSLVRLLIIDLRLGIVEEGEPRNVLEEAMRDGRGWWDTTGRKMIEDLAVLLDTTLPFEETADLEEQRAQIDRIEAWWRSRRR